MIAREESRLRAFVLVAILVLAPLTVHADTVTPIEAQLPPGMVSGSAVWTGQFVYVFGGYDWSAEGSARALDTIARYDPATGAVTVMDARLPSGRYYTSAVWSGEKAYVFGGNLYHAWASDEIVEYDPATDTATLLPTKLPILVEASSAVWAGGAAYVLGGDGRDRNYELHWGRIQRFDPVAGTATLLEARLPDSHGAYSRGVFAGGAAYVAPLAHDGSPRSFARFDPASGEVTLTREFVRGSVSALFTDGDDVYMFGGGYSGDEVVRFDPASGHSTIMPGRTPGHGGKLAVWAGDRAVGFTGAGCSPSHLCTSAFEYTPQAVVPRPRIEATVEDHGLVAEADGTFTAWYWVDVDIHDAPAYAPRALTSPEGALSLLGGAEREAVDWFRVYRYEPHEPLGRLLFVVQDAAPAPRSCLRIVADSGSSEHGLVASEPSCADADLRETVVGLT